MYARYGYNSIDGTSVSGPHARIVENKEVNDHGQEKSNEEKGNQKENCQEKDGKKESNQEKNSEEKSFGLDRSPQAGDFIHRERRKG